MNRSAVALRGELYHNHPLARYTSWRTGGVAKKFYRPADLDDLIVFLKTLPEDEEIIWLGLGSNVLIRDGGIDGTVILTLAALDSLEQVGQHIIRAEAGVTCAKLARLSAKIGLVGGEFFAGIPGTIGGALRMNAGAFKGETWQHVVSVETINRSGNHYIRQSNEYDVGYRTVKGHEDEWFVAGKFQFNQGDSQLAQEAIKQLLKKRADTQPIGVNSCGSVFRNPSGDYAARLIEATGLKRLRVGDAWVSEKHANFIINGGHATAADIELLIDKVAHEVQEKHGVELEREVHIIGKAKK